MSAWVTADLRRVAEHDDLHIAPLRDNGALGTPTWIWSVAVDGALYVRAYNGVQSRWYQSALRQKAGQITAAGKTLDVAFEVADAALNDRIDDAYRTKYGASPYLASMISARARAATMVVTPRIPVATKG
jgi:hypothetical protein